MAGAAFMTFITTGSPLFLEAFFPTKRDYITAIIQQYARNKAFFVTLPFYKKPKTENNNGISKGFIR